jgi:DNA polymerase III epsilon subunit-like protein
MVSVCFDFETGGLELHHPNLQLAAVAVDENYNELASFERKIKADMTKCEAKALEVNHYSEEVWAKEAVSVAQCCQDFSTFLRPYKCVKKVSKAGRPYQVARLFGHNAATFDGPRLRYMFKEIGMFLPAEMHVRCTLQRALWYMDENGINTEDIILGSSLTTLCRYFGIPVLDAHDALGDVRMTVQLAKALTGWKPRRTSLAICTGEVDGEPCQLGAGHKGNCEIAVVGEF